MLLMFSLFAVVAVVLVVATVAGGDDAPPPAFTVFWLFAAGWNAYWWLFRFAYELRVDDDTLTWATPLRTGRIGLDEIIELRPMRFVSNVEVVEHRAGRPVLIFAARGLGGLDEDIARRRPDIPVRVGWQARWAVRLLGSRWRRP